MYITGLAGSLYPIDNDFGGGHRKVAVGFPSEGKMLEAKRVLQILRGQEDVSDSYIVAVSRFFFDVVCFCIAIDNPNFAEIFPKKSGGQECSGNPRNWNEHSPRATAHVQGRDHHFQSMLDGLDEEGCVEESGHLGEKKRRLSIDQVKALEKNFEVENKLEPDRKVKLAQELGLQPRQVAVWFQNRRARWKTKQLERDYGVLKTSYEALKANYDNLRHDNESLLKEIKELKSKLNGENTESNVSVKEEVIPRDSDDEKVSEQPPSLLISSETKDLLMNYDNFRHNDGVLLSGASLFPDFKDGSSDSDSSAVLNENETNIINNNNSSKFNVNPSVTNNGSSSSPTSMNCFEFSTSSTSSSTTSAYQAQQLVKMEEHNFFSGEDACDFFSDEQPPTLQWCCPDQWNYET